MAHVLGFAVDPAYAAQFVHGEVRAAYGGLFTVMGVATVLAAMDPAIHRARILFVGLLWLGIFGGRMFGALWEGNPGMWGWLCAAFEAVLGGSLVLVAQGAGSSGPRAASEYAPPPPSIVPRPAAPPRPGEPAEEPSI
jgi:hypothetical protein